MKAHSTIDHVTLDVLHKAGIKPAAFERFAASERAHLRAEHDRAARGKTTKRDTLADGLEIWGATDPAKLAAEFRAAGVTDPAAVGDICMRAAGGAGRLSAGAIEQVRLSLFAASRQSGRRAAT